MDSFISLFLSSNFVLTLSLPCYSYAIYMDSEAPRFRSGPVSLSASGFVTWDNSRKLLHGWYTSYGANAGFAPERPCMILV